MPLFIISEASAACFIRPRSSALLILLSILLCLEAGEELLTRDIVSVVAITDTAEEEASALADAEAEVEAAVEKD